MEAHGLEAHPPLCLAARDRGKKSQIPWLPWRIFLLWPWGPLGYVVLVLFWEASIWKVVNPQNWSINSLSIRAVHDVMMWNTNSKIIKPWHSPNTHNRSSRFGIFFLPSVQTDDGWTLWATFPCQLCHHCSGETVGCLHWCKYLQAWSEGSRTLLVEIHS